MLGSLPLYPPRVPLARPGILQCSSLATRACPGPASLPHLSPLGLNVWKGRVPRGLLLRNEDDGGWNEDDDGLRLICLQTGRGSLKSSETAVHFHEVLHTYTYLHPPTHTHTPRTEQ